MSVKTYPHPINPIQDYVGCTIVNIRRGKGNRSHFIYANLVDKDGNIIISATLDYIETAIAERLPL